MRASYRLVLGLGFSALVGALCGSSVAFAQSPSPAYPSRTITWVVPYPPGGPPDIVARIFAVPMSQTLGQSIVIENRAGASTAIGTVAVVRAAPDGHTLLVAGVTQAIAPFVLKSPGFDPLKDLKAVGIMARAMQVLAVSPSLPVRDLKELVAIAKSNPDKVKIAHSGVGVPPHLTAIAFMEATGTRLPMVLYRGIAQGVSDVVGGHVTMVFTGASVTASLHDEGKLRILGVTGDKRSPSLPNVPTLDEGGVHLKAMRAGNWFATAAPAGTPDAVIARFNEAVELAGRDPHVIAQLAKLDVDVHTTGPEPMAQLMRSEHDYWRDTFKRFGLSAGE